MKNDLYDFVICLCINFNPLKPDTIVMISVIKQMMCNNKTNRPGQRLSLPEARQRSSFSLELRHVATWRQPCPVDVEL